MMNDLSDRVLLVVLIIGTFVIGWIGNSIYTDYKTYSEPKKYNGLWLPQDNLTKSQAVDTAKEYDTYGNWVCVNIKQMTIEDIYKTCTHETLHEFWVQKCTENVTKCLNGIK